MWEVFQHGKCAKFQATHKNEVCQDKLAGSLFKIRGCRDIIKHMLQAQLKFRLGVLIDKCSYFSISC